MHLRLLYAQIVSIDLGNPAFGNKCRYLAVQHIQLRKIHAITCQGHDGRGSGNE